MPHFLFSISNNGFMLFAFITCKWYRRSDLECWFFDTHFSSTPFNNLFNSCCHRNFIFPIFPIGFRVGLSSFLLEGKLDGVALSTRVLRPTPKETLIFFAWKWNLQKTVIFSISKVSAHPFLLYWLILLGQEFSPDKFSRLTSLKTESFAK